MAVAQPQYVVPLLAAPPLPQLIPAGDQMLWQQCIAWLDTVRYAPRPKPRAARPNRITRENPPKYGFKPRPAILHTTLPPTLASRERGHRCLCPRGRKMPVFDPSCRLGGFSHGAAPPSRRGSRCACAVRASSSASA